MSSAKLIWATPNADALIGYVARVSNPANQNNPEVSNLLRYCAKNSHWSVFEMASACIEINTTRDIGRQLIRHRSFSFSEFSQRYQNVGSLEQVSTRECRLQDNKNRQNSLESEDEELNLWWQGVQKRVMDEANFLYDLSIKRGVAKEQARAILPEGLTPSRLYVSGTLRSWITYCQVRLDASTQKEHRDVAKTIHDILFNVAPKTMEAFFPKEA